MPVKCFSSECVDCGISLPVGYDGDLCDECFGDHIDSLPFENRY